MKLFTICFCALCLGIFAGGLIARAQIIDGAIESGSPIYDSMKFKVNKLFADVSKDPSKSDITQSENDFTILYGRLDYIVKQLDELQNTYSKN